MSGHWPLLNLTIVSIGKSAHFELIKSIICSGWDTKGKQKQLRAPYYMLKDALYFCPNFTGYDNTLKGNTANFQATQEQSWLPHHQSSPPPTRASSSRDYSGQRPPLKGDSSNQRRQAHAEAQPHEADQAELGEEEEGADQAQHE